MWGEIKRELFRKLDILPISCQYILYDAFYYR